jgi:Flp pilus assembly protein TadG
MVVARRDRAVRRCLALEDEGSASVEFTLVSILLIFLSLAVMQVALVLHVRNTVADAAAEGARWAALADSDLAAGLARTSELIEIAVGAAYASDVTARYVGWNGHPAVEVTVSTVLPVIGLWGPAIPLKVSGHAAREVLG